MERGHITIKGDDSSNFTVEIELINGNLWISKWEMAHLFNVFIQTIDGALKSIFKAGLLNEVKGTRIHKFTDKGKECVQTYYNLETLIFVSFRISSLEAKAFRKWTLKTFSEYKKTEKTSPNVIIVLDRKLKIPVIASLN